MQWWLEVGCSRAEWGEGRFCAMGDEAVEVMDMSRLFIPRPWGTTRGIRAETGHDQCCSLERPP